METDSRLAGAARMSLGRSPPHTAQPSIPVLSTGTLNLAIAQDLNDFTGAVLDALRAHEALGRLEEEELLAPLHAEPPRGLVQDAGVLAGGELDAEGLRAEALVSTREEELLPDLFAFYSRPLTFSQCLSLRIWSS